MNDFKQTLTEAIKTALREQPINVNYCEANIENVEDAMRVIRNYCAKQIICTDCRYYVNYQCTFKDIPTDWKIGG